MKVIKTASGKKQIKISKKEWEAIGRKAGWDEDNYSQYPIGSPDNFQNEIKRSKIFVTFPSAGGSNFEEPFVVIDPDKYPIDIEYILNSEQGAFLQDSNARIEEIIHALPTWKEYGQGETKKDPYQVMVTVEDDASGQKDYLFGITSDGKVKLYQ
jgi:hypothetical protein